MKRAEAGEGLKAGVGKRSMIILYHAFRIRQEEGAGRLAPPMYDLRFTIYELGVRRVRRGIF